MSRLTIFNDTDPSTTILQTHDRQIMGNELQALGIRFEQWSASVPLSANADQETVLEAYRADVQRLMEEGGYRSADVVRMQPDHPDRAAMREKFLQEHTHADDEVRFFVEGSGAFYIHKNDRVHLIVCEAGDLLSVPGGTTHWFDASDAPLFTAIRIFVSPEGWVATYTGSNITTRFPLYQREVSSVNH
ncbi:MAG: 1,2-dihydroxy-3-keto-5-methylthiopentene dioxygenase [Chloroflexota bacterium]